MSNCKETRVLSGETKQKAIALFQTGGYTHEEFAKVFGIRTRHAAWFYHYYKDIYEFPPAPRKVKSTHVV